LPEQAAKLRLHLALGLSRGDRMDYAIQKATELGVTEITPLFTEHGEVRLKPDRLENKLRHFEKIAINAAEQCGRLDVPAVNTPLALEAFLAQDKKATRLLLEPGGEQSLTAARALTDIELIIGPEGGFSEREVGQARTSNCEIMRLGPRIFRTETAPVAALAVLQFLYGDLS
jgi:16S rRNA (uracil1498-N3)-methyltransferase